MKEKILRRLRIAARSIVIVVSLVWLWFGITAAWEEGTVLGWVLHILLPGGVVLATVAISVKWERVGALLLVAEGVFFTTWVLWSASISEITGWGLAVLLGILGVPLLISGALLLTAARWEASTDEDETPTED
ncbi:MAG: hypothetical protein QHH80_11630 [Anaerolineae bacterium]|nr:hypothetical protein [Anaerolineae bacterium]